MNQGATNGVELAGVPSKESSNIGNIPHTPSVRIRSSHFHRYHFPLCRFPFLRSSIAGGYMHPVFLFYYILRLERALVHQYTL